MPVVTSSQATFVDITDQRKLSAYITSNLPKTQVEDPNVLPHTYAPSWAETNLVLTPVIFLDQTPVSLGSTGLTISWKRRDGSASEAALTSGEAASGGVLTVSQDKLSASASGMITYVCYVSYYDEETQNTINITSDITYTLVKNAENARLAYVTSDAYVFKYNASGELIGATQATLNAQVQGVSIVKWQYKTSSSSGAWVNYPTTTDNSTITGGTLIVKPTHPVFSHNTVTVKLLTDDDSVYDTITITKLYDGVAGSAGAGGLSVILGNESQTIACTNAGLVQSAVDVTIPFVGYVGTTQVACSVTVGTLPSGVTKKSSTNATASAVGSVVLTFAANATLGGATVLNGTIDLTFTISGKTVTKKFGWSKSVKGNTGATGAAGQNAIVFSVYAPMGTVVINQSGTVTLDTAAYSGSTAITGSYQWAKYVSGTWQNISGATAKYYVVSGADIVNVQSYRCTMTYGGKSYVDVITVEDKSDPYVSEQLSIGGFTIKNGQGGVVPYVIVRQGVNEVDPLLGSISETAPTSPTSGTYWYKIDHSAKTVTLQKYNGSAWATSTDTQEMTYTWHKQDKNGNETTFGKTGKVIYLSAAEIDSIATLQCDVSV